MRRFARASVLCNLLVAIILVAAQAILLWHQTDLAGHSSGGIREWCVLHSLLGDAVPSPPHTSPPSPIAIHAILVADPVPDTSFVPLYASRAPPRSVLKS